MRRRVDCFCEGAFSAPDERDAPACFHKGERCGLPDSAARSGNYCIFCHGDGVELRRGGVKLLTLSMSALAQCASSALSHSA